VRALFAWCKFMIVFIPVTDLVIVMQINYYYYYYTFILCVVFPATKNKFDLI